MSVPRKSRSRSRFLAMAALFPLLGCASAGQGATSKDPDELTRMRQDNAALKQRVVDLEGRVRKMEHSFASPAQVTGAPRELPVVKLGPAQASAKAARATDTGDKDAPKPKDSGKRLRDPVMLSQVPFSGQASDLTWSDEAQEVSSEPEPRQASSSTPASQMSSFRLVGSRLVAATLEVEHRPDKPKRDKRGNAIIAEYDSARSLYTSGEFQGAESAFSGFVQNYPQHDYADNALYWQGEAAYDQGHFADALAAFTDVVERYGGGNKAPDALLKIGLCYGRLGDNDNARDVLTQLVAAYPRADATGIAREKLGELEG